MVMEAQGMVTGLSVMSMMMVPLSLLYTRQATAPASWAFWHFSVKAMTPRCTRAILPDTSTEAKSSTVPVPGTATTS